MKFLITDIDYTIENNFLIARCFGRDENQNRQIVKISGTRPFFLVRKDESIPDDPRIVEVIDQGWKSLKDEPLKIVYVRYPKDIAQRIKCDKCKDEGKILVNDVLVDCSCDNGLVEVGLRGLFKETWQADVVYSQILRIYYGLVGEIEIPNNECHISEVKKIRD